MSLKLSCLCFRAQCRAVIIPARLPWVRWRLSRRQIEKNTRKLSYRKDGRAMRRIILVLWNVSRIPEYTHGDFFPNFNGLLFLSILWICVQNSKFIALPVPEIRGILKNGQSLEWIRPRSLFSEIFNGFLFARTFWIYRPNSKSVALPFPEIIAIEVLGGLRTPNIGEEEAVGNQGW